MSHVTWSTSALSPLPPVEPSRTDHDGFLAFWFYGLDDVLCFPSSSFPSVFFFFCPLFFPRHISLLSSFLSFDFLSSVFLSALILGFFYLFWFFFLVWLMLEMRFDCSDCKEVARLNFRGEVFAVVSLGVWKGSWHLVFEFLMVLLLLPWFSWNALTFFTCHFIVSCFYGSHTFD
jgi:hypothetical protein